MNYNSYLVEFSSEYRILVVEFSVENSTIPLHTTDNKLHRLAQWLRVGVTRLISSQQLDKHDFIN